MSSLLAHLGQSLRRPDHWLYGSWLDTVTQYRRTHFGLIWMLVPTAVYIWGIGGYLGALQPGMDMPRFIAHVAVSFVVFRLIMTVFVDAAGVYSASQSFIYDGNVRLTDFVLRMISRSFYYFLIALPLLIVAVLGSPDFQWSGALGALFGMLVLIINLFAYSVLLSILGARYPDIGELMSSAMMAAFLITPIVWYPENAPEGTTRGMLMRANPFHHLLSIVRAPLLGEGIEPVTVWYLVAMTVFGFIAAMLVYKAFARRVALWL